MLRAASFAVVGVACLAYWRWADPGFKEAETHDDWLHVLAFSTVILALAIVLPLFAQLAGRRRVFRLSLVPAAAAALASVVNIFEDGLHVSWMFYGFVLLTAITLLGLLALTVALVRVGRGRARLLAVVPAGTMAGLILFVDAGGPVLLAAWLAAAALAVVMPRTTAVRTVAAS